MKAEHAIQHLDSRKYEFDSETRLAIDVVLNEIKKSYKTRQGHYQARDKRAKKLIDDIFSVTGIDVLSTMNSRKTDNVFGRSVFFAIMRNMYSYSYPDIGECLGKRHTTVILSIKNSLPSFLTVKRYARMYDEIINIQQK